MGSNISKSNNNTAAQKNDQEMNIGGNPDPRSPTPEITRTPLQNKNGTKHNITKNVDLRKTFESGKTEEKLIQNNPILSAVIKNHLQSYDPRSPTQDFERTPIIISSSEDVLNKQQLRDVTENHCGSPCLKKDDRSICDPSLYTYETSPELILPKNLCDGFYDMSLNDSLKDSQEPLGSSTASNEAIEVNIPKESPKPTTLLETNFDYVDNVEVLEDNIILENEKHDYKNKPLFKILKEDPRSPSSHIERTPIIVPDSIGNDSDEDVEQMSDDSLIKVLQSTNTELRQNVEKKDEILIYEDEPISHNITPKKSRSNNDSSRTPLSCMKNKTEATYRSKSANGKDRKVLAKKVSHIPRLKSLNKPSHYHQSGTAVSLKNIAKASVIGGDCENTPPHSHRDKWDRDNSIVL